MASDALLHQALAFYDLNQPKAELIPSNENMTYKLTDNQKKYVLRIQQNASSSYPRDMFRSGYSRYELIENEMEIISALKISANAS